MLSMMWVLFFFVWTAAAGYDVAIGNMALLVVSLGGMVFSLVFLAFSLSRGL